MAYWSDRSGEYELTLRRADGIGAERASHHARARFRYPPQWSPDSKKLAFIDQAMRIRIFDTRRIVPRKSIRARSGFRIPALEDFQAAVVTRLAVADAMRGPTSAANSAIFLYDTKDAKLHQVTTGYLNDTQPTFDPEGKYLFYASDREFDPVYGSFDNTWTYPNPTKLVGRAAAAGREVAAGRAQRRREPGARYQRQEGRRKEARGEEAGGEARRRQEG